MTEAMIEWRLLVTEMQKMSKSLNGEHFDDLRALIIWEFN